MYLNIIKAIYNIIIKHYKIPLEDLAQDKKWALSPLLLMKHYKSKPEQLGKKKKLKICQLIKKGKLCCLQVT